MLTGKPKIPRRGILRAGEGTTREVEGTIRASAGTIRAVQDFQSYLIV